MDITRALVSFIGRVLYTIFMAWWWPTIKLIRLKNRKIDQLSAGELFLLAEGLYDSDLRVCSEYGRMSDRHAAVLVKRGFIEQEYEPLTSAVDSFKNTYRIRDWVVGKKKRILKRNEKVNAEILLRHS